MACGLAVLLCAIITFNISTPQTRKDSVVEQLSSQSTGLTIMVMIYAMTWGFAFPAYIRFPDKETPDFFPIFQVLNAWLGVFVMIFLGMSSSRFRAGIFGSGSLTGSPLFKYMVSSQNRKRHAFAFGAALSGDLPSGLNSRSMSETDLPTDSIDDDIEKGKGEAEEIASYDSLDDDDDAGGGSSDEAEESEPDSLDDDEGGSDDNDDDDDDDEDEDEDGDDDEDDDE